MGMNNRLLRPRASGFVPTQISNLALWLDAADSTTITTDANTKVSEWRDKSTAAKHCSQGTANNRPAYVTAAQNGRNAVQFTTSTSQSLVQTSGTVGISGAAERTLFTVQQENAPGVNTFPAIFHWGADSNGQTHAHNVFRPVSGSSVVGADIYASGRNALLVAGAYSCVTSQLDSSSAVVAWRNQVAMTQSGTAGLAANTSDTVYTVGRWRVSTVYPGNICEIILYSRRLSSTEIASVEKYLSKKWSLGF